MSQAKILFTGDVMLDWGIRDAINKEGTNFPVKYLKNFLQGFDYRFCNLECPITTHEDACPGKKYVFSAEEKHAAILKIAGINGVSLANNHIFDFGETGLSDTIENLNKSGISFTGAGPDPASARVPVSINIKGIKIAILAYTDVSFGDPEANKNTFSVAPAKIELISEDIELNKPLYDFIVISLHWGIEYFEYPEEKDIRLAHQIINSGADVIIGHHPHIFQGIEIYNGKPIFYSLGNFIFGSINEEAGENILAAISFSKDKIKSFQVFPVNGNGNVKHAFQIKPLSGTAARDALNHLVSISKPLNSEFTAKAEIRDSSLVYSF